MNPPITRAVSRRSHLVVGLSALAVLTITSCGGDDEDGGATTEAAASEPDATATASSAGAASTASSSADTSGSSPAGTGSGSTGDIEDYIEAGADAVATEDREAARCLSAAVINGIGGDKVLATGLSPEEFYERPSIEDTGIELTDQIRADVEANLLDCGDLVQVILDTIDDEAEAACVRQTLTNELIAEQIAVGIVGTTPSPELQEALTAAVTCNTG